MGIYPDATVKELQINRLSESEDFVTLLVNGDESKRFDSVVK